MSQHTVKCFHGYQKKLYGYEESEAHDNGKLKWNSVKVPATTSEWGCLF